MSTVLARYTNYGKVHPVQEDIVGGVQEEVWIMELIDEVLSLHPGRAEVDGRIIH